MCPSVFSLGRTSRFPGFETSQQNFSSFHLRATAKGPPTDTISRKYCLVIINVKALSTIERLVRYARRLNPVPRRPTACPQIQAMNAPFVRLCLLRVYPPPCRIHAQPQDSVPPENRQRSALRSRRCQWSLAPRAISSHPQPTGRVPPGAPAKRGSSGLP